MSQRINEEVKWPLLLHGHPFPFIFVAWIIDNFLEKLLIHFFLNFYWSVVYYNKSMTWSNLCWCTLLLSLHLEVILVAYFRLLLNTSPVCIQTMLVVDWTACFLFGIGILCSKKIQFLGWFFFRCIFLCFHFVN